MYAEGNALRDSSSLFERLGGMEMLGAAIDKLYERVSADPELRTTFENVDLRALSRKQTHALAVALGSSAPARGAPPRTEPETEAAVRLRRQVCAHLENALRSMGLPLSVVGEVMAAVASRPQEAIVLPVEPGLTPRTGEPQMNARLSVLSGGTGSVAPISRGALGASEFEDRELEFLDYAGQVAAIGRTQAVIELELDGTVRSANDNFCRLMGYTPGEILGRHHSMFLDDSTRSGDEDRELWAALRRAEHRSGSYRRSAKGGRDVWIHASYSPLLDLNGRPFKVVSHAIDITTEMSAIHTISESARALAAAAAELTATSRQMGANAEETSTQAVVVSAAAEQVSRSVATVSTGTLEMTASIQEIAKNAHDAVKVATHAVQVAEAANAGVTKLGDSSSEIGKVIKVITSIAQQTNLLALNATIEAARAGDAGKGFAVVANEVKELAKETARATDDISQKIEAIQSDTRSAVTAIGTIRSIIGQINHIQTAIANAVEEQTATTNEIGRNVAEAARGTSEIAQNITGVARAAQSTAGGASHNQRAAAELARMASQLEEIVGRFRH